MNKVWEIASKTFDDIIDQLLYNRGVILTADDEEEKRRFFDPNFKTDLFDPFLMKNMEVAVSRIQKAKENGETIGIISDYDADGIPGAALMYRAMKALSIPCEVFIPNREGGYGMSKEAIDYLVSKKCSLILTIDMGIRNFVEPLYCREIGLDLIITDHHLPSDEIPDCLAVINPKQEGDRYPFKELAGCGVAYKVICALAQKYPKLLDEKLLKWNLDLVAISTIADVVPLSGENRLLAKYGLQVMQKTKNLGLLELIKTANLKVENLSAYHVGFQIAPRINAPGRMDHATKSFELLISEDQTEAKELALWLNEKNESRQKAMDAAEKEAISKIEKDDLCQNKIIVVSGDWSKGIIGPTASRLVERFGRPVIMFAHKNEEYTGSARSVSGVHILELLEKVSSLIEKFGGHKGAAGLSVLASSFAKFESEIVAIADTFISDNDLIKKLKIDCEVDFPKLSETLYEKIILFEPFGMGNSKPVFMAKNVKFSEIKFVGKDKNHLSFYANQEKRRMKSIFFNCAISSQEISDQNFYDIVFNLNMDEWNNQRYLALNVSDFRISE